MGLPLRDALLPRLTAAFPDARFNTDGKGEALAVVPAKHPEVGDVLICDDGDELTVYIGEITHRHFGNYDEHLSPEERAARIATAVVNFLRDFFLDQIELFANGVFVGGFRVRSNRRRGWLSRFFFGRKTYLWSGPLDDKDA
jgi:hypothetical protein